jgi:cysteine desulfurase
MKPREEAVSAFNKAVRENYANPAALHKGGIEAEKIIAAARETILRELGNGEIIFTSGATESNNTAILRSVKPRGKKKIITTLIEHPSVNNTVDRLSNEYEIIKIPPFDNISDYADETTALVSMTAVCGETGFVTDCKKAYHELKRRFPDCIFHVDYAQGFLKSAQADGDLISVSAHKTGGIPGIGLLFVKNPEVRLEPALFGGGQQKGLRSGTEPVALIAGFAEAVTAAKRDIPLSDCPLSDFAAGLKVRLVEGLGTLNITPNIAGGINNIVNFSCGVKSEVMLNFLSEYAICVSSGSACSRGKKSRILPAYKIKAADVDTAIRVSFGWQNTVREVDEFLEVLETGLKRWR